MSFSTRTAATLVAVAAFGATSARAFAPISISRHAPSSHGARGPAAPLAVVRTPLEADREAEKLRAAAARLREEADALEREQAQERARAARRAFDRLDTNRDGALSLQELRAGLEKTYQLEVSEDQARRLLDSFDASGDGEIQPDEFVSIEQFRSRLQAMVDEERRQGLAATQAARKQAEIAQLIESQLELINDKEPSGTDRIASVLPYLLPLVDVLPYGKYLLAGHEGNPLVGALGLLYTAYANVPLGGFLAFLALSVLSGNLSVNRLVRFNAQQALYLDLALFVPGLVATLAGAAVGLGAPVPPALGELGSDAVFAALAACLSYAAASSLLGATPDRIPFLSEAVERRMPSADNILFIDPATGEPFSKDGDKFTEEDRDKTDDV